MPVPNQRFGRDARLSSRLDFRRVFTDGRKTPGRGLTLWSRRDAADRPARLGLSVGAKVGAAVRRMRLKRLTREAFRLHRGELPRGCDLVVSLRPDCRWLTRADAESALIEACRRAGVLA